MCLPRNVHAHARTMHAPKHVHNHIHCMLRVQASVVDQYRQVRSHLYCYVAIYQALQACGCGSSLQGVQAYESAQQCHVQLQAQEAQVAQVGRGLRATRWAYACHRRVLAQRVVQGHAHALEGDSRMHMHMHCCCPSCPVRPRTPLRKAQEYCCARLECDASSLRFLTSLSEDTCTCC